MSAIFDLVFPARCAGCGRGAWPFCDQCARRLRWIAPPWCRRCGRPTERPLDGCAACPPPPVELSRAPLLFRGPARSAVHRLKFAGWRKIADALAVVMATVAPEADALCWVPTSRRRRSGRGYDQAEVLARALASRLGLPALRAVRRERDLPPQARRSGVDRRAAIRGAFGAEGPLPPRLLLVDDVLTTGATAAACAEALEAAGAASVALVTAARAVPGRLPARYTRSDGARPGLWLPGEQLPGSRRQPRAKRPT